MKHLLMLCGYTAYQAGCVAPFMWILVAAAVAYVIVQIMMEDDNGEL